MHTFKTYLIALSLTFASTGFGAETLKLDGGIFDNVDGSAKIEQAKDDQKKVTVNLDNLKPNSLYTVWLVNEKPEMSMTGLGTGDYSFKTDSEGKGNYTATINQEELAKWQVLKVVLHPDGNPKNMKDIKSAATGDLSKVQRAAE